MEPVTHVLTGACLGRTGLNRRAAYATAAMAIAAEFPDIDTLWGLRGPVSGFQHHRGITHTFLGLPFEAGLILLGFILFHRMRRNRRRAPSTSAGDRESDRVSAPVRWGTLYLLLILALLSHLMLDYTNNYGLRPFLPFNDRWYAASIVFIFDPLLFAMLVVGLLLPSLFGLVGREIGARRERYSGRGWARAALVGVVLLWGVRYFAHGRAIALAQAQTLRAPASSLDVPPADLDESSSLRSTTQLPVAPTVYRPLLQPQRSLASPDPLSIFRWYTVTDYGPAYTLGTADTELGTWQAGRTLQKPAPNPVLETAKASELGRVYLDWSPMPELSISDGVPNNFYGEVSGESESYRTVTFSDPRFMGDVPLLRRGQQSPLTGQVVINPDGKIDGEAVDGRFGR